MKCPHCLVNFHSGVRNLLIAQDIEGYWFVSHQSCSACDRAVLTLVKSKKILQAQNIAQPMEVEKQQLINPRGSTRPPCPSEVSKEIAEDYLEACVVLPDSSKASAALSRRCLQALLREKGGVKPGDLSNEIQQVIDSNSFPSHLADSIDAIRNIGNFSAHPLKSKNTGEILPVEEHEAEWNLDVLESLFDFYYVQPAKLQAKRNALNQKLAEAGKPPMK
jgi:Domain of unknown function (DUF4145)